jgi:site-specific recombinase XerD
LSFRIYCPKLKLVATAFELWLTVHSYRPATRRTSLREVALSKADYERDGQLVQGSRLDSLRRYVAFLQEHPAEVRSDFDRAVLAAVKPPGRKHTGAKRGRKNQAVSFPEQEWYRFVDAVQEATEPEARVLEIQCVTSYRVGDVLGIERRNLAQAMSTGLLNVEVKTGKVLQLPIAGAKEVWDKVYASWPKEHATMAAWVCPRAGEGTLGPYQRVRRYLQGLCAELGIDSRVYTHRIRRTVGVRALKRTRDIHLVSQLFGHASIASTQIYTDELRAEELTNLHRKLRDHAQEDTDQE